MMELRDYLNAAPRRPWAWGEWDCATFPAGWVVEGWGAPDPFQTMRGSYSDKRSATALIDRAGGLERLWASAAQRIGAVGTSSPVAGDVGVVWMLADAGPEKVGAICAGEKWAVLGLKGLMVGHADCVRAWRRG